MRATTVPRSSSSRRVSAARSALALCASADAVAREVEVVVVTDADDHRLFALLEQRDVMLQDLAEQLLVLRQERPTADSALFAATEQVVDEADALVADVCAAVSSSHRTTVELAAKVARRAEELRSELDAVQRASTAGMAYGMAGGARVVDSRR